MLAYDLIQRYAANGPRYTSYPPATSWHNVIDAVDLRMALAHAAEHLQTPLSLYVHLPFCPSQCWFCACNVLITPRTDLADAYLDHLERELALLGPSLPQAKVAQMHWGGGSPSYLTPPQMRRLSQMLRQWTQFQQDAEIAIEVDPRITTLEHLQTLRELGFNRLSMGVQDFDKGVQKAIHRVQSAEMTQNFAQQCRDVGFKSLNMDLIYGLPGQTPPTMAHTLEKVIEIRPDRIALYGYAHVPWLKPFQRKIDAELIPNAHQRFVLFRTALERLLVAGYQYIGLDHFALPEDELAKARKNGTLQRNFMGYTTVANTNLLGLGLSAISFVQGLYAQNEHKLNPYYAAIDAGQLPVTRGYLLTPEDRLRADVIQALMCVGRVDKRALERRHGVDFDAHFADELRRLRPLQADGLLELLPDAIQATATGTILIRSVAMIFDGHLPRQGAEMQRFSAVV